jgi:stage V sporulation protein S
MEDNLSPVRKLSFQKKKPKKNNNSNKNNIELYSAMEGKDLNDSELEEKHYPSQVKKRKNVKFNSNDNISLFLDNNKDKNYKLDATSSPRKNKKILKKNDYYAGCEEYLEKLYEDEPHLKKGVFKKKSNNKFIRNFNRKVSFISPKNNKTKQNINLLRLNKNNTIYNKTENNNSKSKVIKENDEMGDEQSYGYDKKYNASLLKGESNNNLIKTAILSKKDFDGRDIKRRQTNKTCKSNNNNVFKFRNFEKKNTTNINFKRDIKDIRKKVSSKSNPNSVAGALANVFREKGSVEIQAIGAGALNQAIKAIAIARGFVAPSGKNLVCIPAFTDIVIDGDERTAIKLIVESK